MSHPPATPPNYTSLSNCSRGFSLALVAGVFFGTQFIVIEYMKLCTDRAHSCSGMLVSHPHTHRAHSCSGMLVSHPHTQCLLYNVLPKLKE